MSEKGHVAERSRNKMILLATSSTYANINLKYFHSKFGQARQLLSFHALIIGYVPLKFRIKNVVRSPYGTGCIRAERFCFRSLQTDHQADEFIWRGFPVY